MTPVPAQLRPQTDSGVSLEEAITALENAATTPRAHAAIKTLRDELNISDSRKTDTSQSPGQKAAADVGGDGGFPAAMARMRGQ